MSETPTPSEPNGDEGKTFTQADVDAAVEKIAAKIRAEERRKVSEKFADYDDLKTKAGTATTLEERVAQIERQAQENQRRAEVAEVANAKGLTPTQAKRLVGNTREELEADADVLLADLGAQKKQGNHAPREGNNPKPQDGDGEMRSFTKELFGRAVVD
jgi:hypothetical protein